MRDKWLTRMNGGRLPLQERGMLATLWDWGQPLTATDEEMSAIMCDREWYKVAASLAAKGKISLAEESGWTTMRLILPDERRRRSMAAAQRKRRKGQSGE